MTVVERKGDILTTEAKIIGIPSNRQATADKGLAKRVKEVFPWAHEEFSKKAMMFEVGGVVPTVRSGQHLLHMIIQESPGVGARYNSLHDAMAYTINYAEMEHRRSNTPLVLALPKLSEDPGDLEPKILDSILRAMSNTTPVIIEVWSTEEEASGTA